MLSNEEAYNLIKEEKLFLNPPIIDLAHTKYNFEMESITQKNFKFFVDIEVKAEAIKIELSVGRYKTWKTSHNHRSKSVGNIGLLRVDFGGKHKNPSRANEHVPSWIARFAGKYFERYEPHVHIYVETYSMQRLKWAVPLEVFDFDGKAFSVKAINSIDDLERVTREFEAIINARNRIRFMKSLFWYG
ncbi:DUF6978 family protein [Thermovibrio ammonificans]